MSVLNLLYLAFSHIAEPFWRLVNRRRSTKGQDVPERQAEKYGQYDIARPTGQLIWLHGSSVSETLALLQLIERALLARPEAHVLLTTSSSASAEALKGANLPNRCVQVLLPIDTPRATRAFLEYWRPEIVGFTEPVLWPRLMVETAKRRVPMVLVNGRMPKRKFEHYKRKGRRFRDMLRFFDRLLVQDGDSAKRLVALGAKLERIRITGSLKAAADPLPVDDMLLADLKHALSRRSVWLAAATAGSEDPLMIQAHKLVRKSLPDAMMILVPRQTADGETAKLLAEASFPRVAQRSTGDQLGRDLDVYVADTVGEMGLWYRLSPISFLGHSMGDGLEGIDPFEAAALGTAIIHGPEVHSFLEGYAALTKAGAARLVGAPEALAAEVIRLQDRSLRYRMAEGADQVIAAQSSVVEDTWREIDIIWKQSEAWGDLSDKERLRMKLDARIEERNDR